MKENKKIILWGTVTAAVILLAVPKIPWGEKSAEENQGGKPVQADALILHPQKVENVIHANASLMGDEEVEIRSEVSGKVVKINFEEGSKVNKGDLLVKINDAELQAQLKRALSQLNLAEEKAYRIKQLLEKNLASQEEYDVVVNDLQIRNADVELLKAQIDKTEITAPFDGIVGLRWISEGSIISPSVVITNLVKANPIKINFAVPQKYFDKVDIGKIVDVRMPADSKIYKAKIYAIDPKIDRSTRSLQVRALTGNAENDLFPGAYAEVEITVDVDEFAFNVPTEALVPDIQGEKVFLYKSGTAVPHSVKTGLRTDRYVQITEGVSEGDTVITSAIIQLRPGINVQLKNIESD